MMARRFHEVHLVCPWCVKDGAVIDGVVLHTFRRAQSRAKRPFSIPWHLARKLCPLITSMDLVHFHDIDILPWMSVLALFKPVIYDVHENYPDEMLVRQWIPRLFRKALFHLVRFAQSAMSRTVHNVIFVIPEIGRHFPTSALHLSVVRNFATLDLLQQVAPDYLTRPDAVIFLASNYEGNGTFLFLELADRLKNSHPQIRFLMIDRWSDGATRERAMKIIRDRHLANVAVLPNVQPQRVMEYLNIATVGIAPGLRETKHINALPTKLFEYMAAGLPIVSSDLPSAKQLAFDTGAILLCRPEEPETYVSAIESLIADRKKANELGQSGQNAFRKCFCWEAQADAIEKYYTDVIGKEEKHLHPLNFNQVKQ